MTLDPHALPHEPAPEEPRQLIPEWPLLVRGLLLAGAAAISVMAAWKTARASAWLLPVSAVATLGGVLAAWASAIQLTGGVKHDDHPWV